jgi:hypothetical protein
MEFEQNPDYKQRTIVVYNDLLDLRRNWSDNIPNTEIHGQEWYCKVRKNWWQSVLAKLGKVKMLGLFNQELNQDYAFFVNKFSSEEFINRPTSAEDIKIANNIIDKVLNHLEQYIN